MLDAEDTFGIDPSSGYPERALAFGYAPAASRAGLIALFALDAMLARLARRTREPVVAQMRLAWWRDSLGRIEDAPIAGQPILEALNGTVIPRGVSGRALATIVDGWESLVAGEIAAHGRDRGRGLFGAAATVLGSADAWVADAGEGWALADVAVSTPDAGSATLARDLAVVRLDGALEHRASRNARALGALALSARMDLTAVDGGSPRRVLRLLRYRLTGR